MTTRRRPDSGTTLLELLVSLAVLAAVAVTVSSLFETGRRVWDRTDDMGDAVEIALGEEKLSNWLEAMPLPSARNSHIQFLGGSSNAFRFVIPVVELGHWDPATAILRVALDETGTVTVKESIRGDNSVPERVTAVLSRDQSALRVSYFGDPKDGRGRAWYPDWSVKPLPDLVKIERTNSDGRMMPPLTIQPGKDERQRYLSLSSLVPPG